VLQYYTAPDLVFWMIPSQDYIGPFIYKNHFAAFVELLFPVAIVRILVDRERALLWGIVAATLFAAVVVSASRGGVALLTAELVAVLAIGARRRWIPGRRVLLLSLQLPVLFAVLVGIFGFQSIWEHFHEASSADIRKKLLVSTLEMIRQRPARGFGLGTWRTVYPRYARFDNARYANEAHNDWAQWAAEGGLPFALILAGVALWTMRSAWRRPWALGPAAIFVHSLIDYPTRDPAVMGLMFVMLGAAAAATAQRGTGSAAPKTIALRPVSYSGS
jgi:O-antigen ligase